VEVGTGSLDGVAPSRMVGVSASVNLPLHHKVQNIIIIIIRKFITRTCSQALSMNRRRGSFFWHQHQLTRVVPEKGP